MFSASFIAIQKPEIERKAGIFSLSLHLTRWIKTHGSVSCGPRSRRATPVSILTGRTKTSFSHLCISVITYPIGTKFATQLPASQSSLHSKFEGNRSSHFRDTSCQGFVFFLRFFLLLRLFAHLQKLL